MSFAIGSTRKIEVGDTPGFNDDVVSRRMDKTNIQKGTPSFIADGIVKAVNSVTDYNKRTPFVPTESVDNSTATNAGDGLPINGVGPGQQVALKNGSASTLNPGDIIKLGVAGIVIKWATGDKTELKYARYFGKEAGVFDRSTTTAQGLPETLSNGVRPDQILATAEVGWFQLLEPSSGKIV